MESSRERREENWRNGKRELNGVEAMFYTLRFVGFVTIENQSKY